MTITNSELVLNRSNPTSFKRRVGFRHTDHLGLSKPFRLDKIFVTDPVDYPENEAGYQAALLVEATAIMNAHAITYHEQLAKQEIQEWIQEMEAGNDPWHTAPYVNVAPEFNDWSTIASESLKHWLLKVDRQELLNCNASISSTSNGDLDDLLTLCGSSFGQTNLRAEVQIAVNTQVDLDSYSPSVVG